MRHWRKNQWWYRRAASIATRHAILLAVIGLTLLIGLGGHLMGVFAQAACANGDSTYTVQWGDTLVGIASRYNTASGELAAYNHLVNPNVIFANQHICIPHSASAANSVVGPPTITPNFINTVLAAYHSPAAGKGQALYDLGVTYGIDPAFALAFFRQESTFGTAGVARYSRSLGNIRNGCCGYVSYATWEQGFEAWYKLIRNLYVEQWGLVTVEQIIPRYAPSSDNNNETAYIYAVETAVGTWRQGQVTVLGSAAPVLFEQSS